MPWRCSGEVPGFRRSISRAIRALFLSGGRRRSRVQASRHILFAVCASAWGAGCAGSGCIRWSCVRPAWRVASSADGLVYGESSLNFTCDTLCFIVVFLPGKRSNAEPREPGQMENRAATCVAKHYTPRCPLALKPCGLMSNRRIK